MAETSLPTGPSLSQISGTWRDIAQSAARTLGLGILTPSDPSLTTLKQLMEGCINGPGGEVSQRMRTADLGRIYLELDKQGREGFLTCLAADFAPDENKLRQSAENYLSATTDAQRTIAANNLRQSSAPERLKLLTQFNALPNGVKFLVDMRTDLLTFKGKDPYLQALDSDLQQLLSSWFDIGFLDFVEMTWRTPAALLEKLITYEAVHQITSWQDLKNRLDSDRRCYALFHPRMPNEPLAFVEVALVKGLADNVQHILDVAAPLGDPQNADTAIFYSITNTQTGLRGISFGEHLIKKVVPHLSRELPQIKSFSTLSPVPGFKRWLESLDDAVFEEAVTRDELKSLQKATKQKAIKSAIFNLIDQEKWFENFEKTDLLRGPLLRLNAAYFLEKDPKGRALDPVARFHLKNGAELNQINWMGDVSDKGISQAVGIMVNYKYDLAKIEKNHELFINEGIVAMSTQVRAYLKQLNIPYLKRNPFTNTNPLQKLRKTLSG
ncbi:malonyl-CoA decarboxylase [Kiloniella antarctica]|uniref:Malonyl-CoA decarboxylase n=1 Tax=Kiloniella antarctica TaxID=1550907 RepID=A0ABW5BKP4_9PROT